MAGQIIFFEKNKADFSNQDVVATATEGNDFIRNVLNRNNLTAWITTNSVDANDTTVTLDMADTKTVSDILLLKHNFKSFNIKYWDGATYQDFTPAINESTNTLDSNYFEVTPVSTSRVQLIIHGTQTADTDKVLYQFIVTEKLGRLEGWPLIKSPTLSRNRQKTVMLSGKTSVMENIGSYSVVLKFTSFSSEFDLSIIEALYSKIDGFLFWPCGGVESQFRTIREGYRMEDIYLMKPTDEYSPEYDKGLYKSGMSLDVKLTEVTE
jgi:hypothetical protein